MLVVRIANLLSLLHCLNWPKKVSSVCGGGVCSAMLLYYPAWSSTLKETVSLSHVEWPVHHP